MEKKVVKRGNGAAIPMTRDMLDLLGVEVGDSSPGDLEEPTVEIASDDAFDEAMDAVLEENAGVLRQLTT